jgi:ribonuclease G
LPLSLFRRKKRKEEQAPPEAAAPATEPEAPVVAAPADEPPADGQPTTQKRRRGTRGGRGRKRPAAKAGEAAAVAEAHAEPAAKPARKPQERSQQRQRARPPRRTPQRRAPLPKAKRELLVSVDAGEKRVAVLEDDRVAEVYLERPEHRSIAGNVYLGTVDNVLPGMEAAFVEIGLEKNGFLYVDEIVGPELEGRKGARKIQDLIQKGQTILVQAVKDPMKTKGARLTTEISLPGRFVVFVPFGDGLGVSRRLEEDERNRLKAIVKELAPPHGGVIVRTAAEGASAEDVARDLDFLRRLWKTIEARAKTAKAPSLIYQEAELPLRVTRDLFTGEFERLVVDHDLAHKRIVGYLKKTSPHMVERVVRYRERAPLMEAFGVEQEIKSTLNRRVDLPSGGYLIFDYAEAFTVIDVNTGRFVGSRSKNSPGRLEDTITKNNLEAVKEVVRQLRLRDIGGIIVIDFIDMANPKNRATVEEALRHELERDRTKTYVVEISPLGLVEMTRQNVTDGPREVMTRRCPTCDGDGIVVSDSTTALEIERKLRALVTPGGRAKAFKVELNSRIAALVAGPAAARLRELEDTTKRRFFLVGRDDLHLDHFRLLEQGTVEKLAPESPLQPGQEVTLKLGQVGLHDPRSAVGGLDGVDVNVAGAAKLVGKKVPVRLTAVLDGVAYAELVDRGDEPEQPITAEAEAEKPTRARRPAKKAEEPEGAETEAPEAIAEEALAEDGDEEQAAAAKKRTRRGTRGGRNRRKKAAPVSADDAAAEAAPEPAAEAEAEPAPEPQPEGTLPPAPVIHLPSPDLGREDDEAPAENGDQAPAPRKRTRRGSRGGRNRKKKTTAATTEPGTVAVAGEAEPEETPAEPGAVAVADDAEPDETPAEPEPAADEEHEEEVWSYTPMSEWDGIDGRSD